MNGNMRFFLKMVCIPAALIIISSSFLSGKSAPVVSSEFVNIEDSLIIRNLSMESDQPQEDTETGQGLIIYDDSFDDTITEYNPSDSKSPSVNRSVNHSLGIADLRKKDPRWHTVSYTIKKNDNLWKIAQHYRVSHTLIISINNIKNPDMMKPGRKIMIPSKKGIYYRVKKGDTVSHISARFRVPSDKIIKSNNIRPRYLAVGNKIFIPEAVTRRYSAPAPVSRAGRTISSKNNRISLSWPLRGRITSGFGTRKDPFTGKKSFHCGIDISAPVGTVIRAASAGRVIFSGWKHGYGRIVILRHDRGYITVYAHNSKNQVRKGQMVSRGEKIALSGMTGAVTGAHLHFELRKYVTPLNPLRFIK